MTQLAAALSLCWHPAPWAQRRQNPAQSCRRRTLISNTHRHTQVHSDTRAGDSTPVSVKSEPEAPPRRLCLCWGFLLLPQLLGNKKLLAGWPTFLGLEPTAGGGASCCPEMRAGQVNPGLNTEWAGQRSRAQLNRRVAGARPCSPDLCSLPPNITPTPGPRGSEVSHANRRAISSWDRGGWVTTRNSARALLFWETIAWHFQTQQKPTATKNVFGAEGFLP